MVDDNRSTVGQVHLLGAVAASDEIDRRRGVVNNVDPRRRAGHQRPVEPLEVLAHQAPRKEVVALDRLTRRVDHAPVVDPVIAASDRPLVQTNCVRRLVLLDLERIQGQLAAGIVEQQVVGLFHVVDARAGGSRLDDVHGDVNPGPMLLSCSRDDALQGADTPWSQSNYRDT